MNLFSSCFRLLYCVISDSWVCTGYLTRQRGQENQVIITLQLSMSIATMEEEIVCVCYYEIKPGHETAISETSSCVALNFQRPG